MKTTEQIKSLIKKFQVTADAEMHQKILSDALAAQGQAQKRRSAVLGQRYRWRFVKGKTFKGIAVVAALFIAAICIWPGGIITNTSQAKSLVVRGAVLVRSEGIEDWIRREAGSFLSTGDELRVADGSALVRLDDGTQLALGHETRLVLRDKEENSGYSIFLRNGDVTAEVAKRNQAFWVESTEGIARSLGTTFRVQLVDNFLLERRLKMEGILPIIKRLMAVTVMAGVVQLQANGHMSLVEAGAGGIVMRNEVPLVGPEAEAILKKLRISSEIRSDLKPLFERHDEYIEQLFVALATGDCPGTGKQADALSELWQALGQLARAKTVSERWIRLKEQIEAQNRTPHYPRSDSKRIVLDYSQVLMAWLNEVEDIEWLHEIGYVCKQMEEYAEEMRDGGRQPELGLPYTEHCLPSFIAYCQGLKTLPWDNPSRILPPADILGGIQRDLEIARRELWYLENREAKRIIKRSLENAERLTITALERIKGSEYNKQVTIDLTELTKMVAFLRTTAAEVERRSFERQRDGMERGEGFRQELEEKAEGETTNRDLLIESIEEGLRLNQRLQTFIFSKQ